MFTKVSQKSGTKDLDSKEYRPMEHYNMSVDELSFLVFSRFGFQGYCKLHNIQYEKNPSYKTAPVYYLTFKGLRVEYDDSYSAWELTPNYHENDIARYKNFKSVLLELKRLLELKSDIDKINANTVKE